jgi:hypothetical protein
MVWPWNEFNWGVFWALIVALFVADVCKGVVQYVLGKLSE